MLDGLDMAAVLQTGEWKVLVVACQIACTRDVVGKSGNHLMKFHWCAGTIFADHISQLMLALDISLISLKKDYFYKCSVLKYLTQTVYVIKHY